MQLCSNTISAYSMAQPIANSIKQVRPEVPIIMLADNLELPDGALNCVDAVVTKADGAHFLWATVHFVLNVKRDLSQERKEQARRLRICVSSADPAAFCPVGIKPLSARMSKRKILFRHECGEPSVTEPSSFDRLQLIFISLRRLF